MQGEKQEEKQEIQEETNTKRHLAIISNGRGFTFKCFKIQKVWHVFDMFWHFQSGFTAKIFKYFVKYFRFGISDGEIPQTWERIVWDMVREITFNTGVKYVTINIEGIIRKSHNIQTSYLLMKWIMQSIRHLIFIVVSSYMDSRWWIDRCVLIFSTSTELLTDQHVLSTMTRSWDSEDGSIKARLAVTFDLSWISLSLWSLSLLQDLSC